MHVLGRQAVADPLLLPVRAAPPVGVAQHPERAGGRFRPVRGEALRHIRVGEAAREREAAREHLDRPRELGRRHGLVPGFDNGGHHTLPKGFLTTTPP